MHTELARTTPIRHRLSGLGMMLTAAILLTAAPLAAQETRFPATLDEAYTGRFTIELFPAEGGGRIHRDWGDAEILFVSGEDGTVEFITRGEDDEGSGFEVSVTLTGDDDGIWRSLAGDGIARIDAAGRVLSASHSDGFDLFWSGEIGMEKGSLTFRRIPTASAPAEERDITAIFSIEVQRPRPEPKPEPDAETEASGGDGGCERIEWRLVNRWDPWGGGLSLEREPFCVN
ncbi:hypothetical protein [Pelagibacterium lacus]|uniref:hypothetical protein n=1 Tax=Pelagibacterium lacus TaxID=2282655 RepID=UPI0011C04F2F|nr:hypothetical protein [Pelagibacterium lacus]